MLSKKWGKVLRKILKKSNFRLQFQLPSYMTRKHISTSAPRKALPPILVFLVKPLSRIAAAILGRIGRKWWRKLPDSEKADLRNHLKQNRKLIAGSSIALAILLGSFGYDSVSITEP